MGVSIAFVKKAMGECRCTTEEFFNRAALAGSAPRDLNVTAAAKEFEFGHSVAVPKFVGIFAVLVNDHRCPRNCPRNCKKAEIAPAVVSGMANSA